MAGPYTPASAGLRLRATQGDARRPIASALPLDHTHVSKIDNSHERCAALGLSRIERVSADMLGHLLLLAWQRPWMPEYISALPIAGVDGTARRRLRDSAANGRAHIKTGSLNGVRAIAGYVLDRNGRRHAVVMMVNHAEAAASAAAQDALLEWVWAGGL